MEHASKKELNLKIATEQEIWSEIYEAQKTTPWHSRLIYRSTHCRSMRVGSIFSRRPCGDRMRGYRPLKPRAQQSSFCIGKTVKAEYDWTRESGGRAVAASSGLYKCCKRFDFACRLADDYLCATLQSREHNESAVLSLNFEAEMADV